MSEETKIKRNLRPHKYAVAAMFIFSSDYAAQRLGSMDFYESLSANRKSVCADFVKKIERYQINELKKVLDNAERNKRLAAIENWIEEKESE